MNALNDSGWTSVESLVDTATDVLGWGSTEATDEDVREAILEVEA